MPLLAGTLGLSLVIVGLHLYRHHQPGPFIVSAFAAGSVFFAIYGIGFLPHASSGDHMADGMAASPTWSPYPAYGAILVLLLAQIWDIFLFRQCVRRTTPAFLETRKGGNGSRRIGGIALTVTSLLACPCHLIITLPLLLSGLSGTALGSFLSRNTSLIYTGAAIYFVVALAVGVFFLFGRTGSGTQEKTTCSTCIPADANIPEQRR